MATLTTVVPPRVYFCNGMNTSRESAKKTQKQLAGVIGEPVHLHYNGVTGSIESGGIGLFALLGIALGVGSFFTEDKSKKNAMRVGAVASLAGAGVCYTITQGEKRDEGKRLAERVIKYLKQDPRRHVLLILHSQGADVGNRALKYHLEKYKDRIEVITVGPAVQIPLGRAHRIKEIQNSGDWISRVAVAFNSLKSSSRKPAITRVDSECADWTCHGIGDSYLSDPSTAEDLRLAVRPRCFIGDERVKC